MSAPSSVGSVPASSSAVDLLPAQRSGAKALLLTVLGEFVLPAGGSAWTATLVSTAGALGIGEKNARQALSRIGDQGLIEGERHGRSVRWSLTRSGRDLLETGARRIYGFGARRVGWDGVWLVAHCPVAESRRSLRNQLRARLGFLGFGELAASLQVSPHLDREAELDEVLTDLGLAGESTVLHSRTASPDDDRALVGRAWDLEQLTVGYETFTRSYAPGPEPIGEEAFRSVVELVHDWRRFPFTDPELPSELLPPRWAGDAAAAVFRERHAAWSAPARAWFTALDEAPPAP